MPGIIHIIGKFSRLSDVSEEDLETLLDTVEPRVTRTRITRTPPLTRNESQFPWI